MDYPKYSVLLSVYSKENPEWFDGSIRCMLNQTIKPSEFIIVEDGPLTPDLYSVIEKYVKSEPNIIRIITIEKNSGLGPALRLGIEKCTNEFIARMDSDDYCKPERVQKELDFLLSHPEIGMVGTNVIEFIDNISNEISKVVLPEKTKEIELFSKKRNPFRHPSVLYKRSEVLKAGNYREYYLFEDYDMWVRMIKSGCKCYNIQEFLTYMRIGNDFYKRRGGRKYLVSVYRFKSELLYTKYISFFEFLKTFIPHAIVCLLPNRTRDYIYKKYLRK